MLSSYTRIMYLVILTCLVAIVQSNFAIAVPTNSSGAVQTGNILFKLNNSNDLEVNNSTITDSPDPTTFETPDSTTTNSTDNEPTSSTNSTNLPSKFT